jgi:hypothetical protein
LWLLQSIWEFVHPRHQPWYLWVALGLPFAALAGLTAGLSMWFILVRPASNSSVQKRSTEDPY